MNLISHVVKAMIAFLLLSMLWQCQDKSLSLLSDENEVKKSEKELEKSLTVNLKIISYNIFHLPSSAAIQHYKEQFRATGQREFFNKMFTENEVDVIAVQEAFNKYSTTISNELPLFIEQSGLVGWYCGGWKNDRRDDYFEHMSSLSNCSNSIVVVNGGVKIYSKWPILYDEQLIFKSSHPKTWDYWSNKGAAYVKINKQGKLFHVIGTHLQADEEGDDGSEVRKQQLEELEHWIYGKINTGEISTNEPILFIGDFNIPHFNTFRVNQMTTVLKTHPVALGNNLHTYEPNNTLHKVKGYHYQPQTLDYILLSKLGKQPACLNDLSQETIQAVKLNEDLSDHHPIQQSFSFRYIE
ncbi:sphingomyelin phosphodiesterase [Tenacibaculum sp. TC6]|uniref:sphingomyelin phosphodiesterase n=1 Tax=Tenacibaculum sp. TC6 TaxID=3423223 RepID=UPI003D3640A8